MQKRKNIPKRPVFYGVLVGAMFLMSVFVLNAVQPVLARGEGDEVLFLPLEQNVDNKFQDLSAFQNHGTDHNTAPADGPPQVGGKARYFAYSPYQGVGGQAPDWIDLGDDESLRLDQTDFTIAFWLKFAGYSWDNPGDACVFFNAGGLDGNDNNQMIWLGVVKQNTQNKIKLGFFGSHCVFGYSIPFMTYTHIAVTFDRETTEATLYINGAYSQTLETNGRPDFWDWNGCALGRHYKGTHGGGYWEGQLDEVHVYKRQLSDPEVAQLQGKGQGKEVLDLRLESSINGQFQDLSEFQNHGTDHNTAPTNGPPQVGGKARYFAYYSYQGEGGQAPDWIGLGDDESLRLDQTDFTIAFWLKFAGYAWDLPENEGNGNQACIFVSKGKRNENDLNDMVWVGIKRENKKNKVQLGFNGLNYQLSACSIELCTWTHIAITFAKSTTKAKFYKNGKKVDEHDMGSVPSIKNWEGAELGRLDEYGGYWAGRLDEVHVYKRQLSNPEVAQLQGKEVLDLRLESSVNGQFQDLSEFQNHGTDHNTAPADGPPRVGGKARYFAYYSYQGEGGQAPDWIDLGDDESLRLDQTDFTIAFWLKFAGYAWDLPENEGNGNQACIFVSKGKRNENDLNDMVWVGIKRENKKNKVQLGFNGLNYQSNACSVEFYTWTHIALTFDRSSAKAKFYKNGIHVDTHVMTGVPSFEDWSGAELGRWDEYGGYWEGQLDEVHVYKRLLSVADVFRLWASFSGSFYGYFNVQDYPSSNWGNTVDDIKDDIDAVASFTNLIYVPWYLMNTEKEEENYNPDYVQYIIEQTNLTMFVGLPHYPKSNVFAVIKLFDPDRAYGDRILAYYLDEPGCPTRLDHPGKRFSFENLTKWCNDVHTASKAYYGYEIKTMVLFSSLWDYNGQNSSHDEFLNHIPEGVDIVCIEPYPYPDPKPPEKTYREYVAYIDEMLRKPDLDGPWQTSVTEAYDWVNNVTTEGGMPRPVIMLGQANDNTSIGVPIQMLYRRNFEYYVELALAEPLTIGILWYGYLRSRYYDDVWVAHRDISADLI